MRRKYAKLLRLLNKHADEIVSIIFTKADGTERVLRFSWEITNIKAMEAKHPSGSKERRAKHPNLLVVWDLDKDGWRTVNLDTMRSMRIGEREVL